MTTNTDFGSIDFDLPKNQSNVIKVIGVGGGGSNAINHMFKQGIKGVDFIVCNTDSQALQNSPVPNKIQLGINLTEGLGAGANPSVGQQSAMESIPEIEKMLDTNTKMIFITAGMGGGTGTGAAPVIAELAREKDILTVGIVTIPFAFEGKIRTEQAIIGIEKLRKHVDSLIVVNNNKLREVYGNLGFKAGFSKADEVLATASRGIAEVITHHYTQNIDLKDAKTVLANSGTAIMGSSTAFGDNRAIKAIKGALDSPLLDDNKITGAKNVLLLIVSGSNEITIDEIGEISDYIQKEAGNNANIIMGVGEDEKLDESIAVTIIATGFDVEQQNQIVNTEPKKIIHALEDDQKIVRDLIEKPAAPIQLNNSLNKPEPVKEKVVYELIDDLQAENKFVPITDYIKNIEVNFEIISPISETQLIATTAEIANFEVIDYQIITANIQKQDQNIFNFNIPLNENNATAKNQEPITESPISYDFSNINEIKVVEPVSYVNTTELNENGIVRYSLEEYMELEETLNNSKPVAKNTEPAIDKELDIVLKTSADPIVTEKLIEKESLSISPMEMTIEESLKIKNEERIRKLKEYNHKFKNNNSTIDELEKTPAFQRSGVELTEPDLNNKKSRYSISTDSNNETQVRSNNSFLHDIVD
jgi:cell division protein FtsZ